MEFLDADPGLQRFFEDCAGYAIFPSVGKAALIAGGSHGNGFLVENNRVVGTSSITELTIGVQAGGQSFAELLFFKDSASLERFKQGNFEFGSQMSVALAKLGEAAKSEYDKGTAVFLLPRGGLMIEASIGGQRFSYEALPADAVLRK